MIGRVYNIGDFKIEVKPDCGGFTYEGDKQCHHRNLTFDENGQTVSCKDCELQVTAFWAFLMLAKQYKNLIDDIQRQRDRLAEEQARNLTHKAAIAVEDAWRKRKMIPTCPHCKKPVLPGDNFGALGGLMSKDRATEGKPMEFRAALEIVAGYKAEEA